MKLHMRLVGPAKAAIAVAGPALVVSAAIFAGAGTAAAAPGPTPNGLTGAANMTNTSALPGMLNAMSVNNRNGDNGMFCAVYITNGVTAPGSCGQP